MDVADDELCSFYEREAGYHIRRTPYWERDANGDVCGTGEALLCTACADDEEADALWAAGGAMEKHCPGRNNSLAIVLSEQLCASCRFSCSGLCSY